MDALLVVAVVVLLGYRFSLTLHPYTPCEVCRGRGGRHRAFFFRSAWRACHACSGGGRKQRWGARMLGLGEPRYPRPSGIWAPAAADFPPPIPRRRRFTSEPGSRRRSL